MPLYTQETGSTCGSACGRMILAYHGIYCDETEFKTRTEQFGNHTTVAFVVQSINSFLEEAGSSVRYQYCLMGNSVSSYRTLIQKNINANRPIQIPLDPKNSTSYFPYPTDGHYVVITGFRGDTILVNDPCDGSSHGVQGYNQKPLFPLSVITNYSQEHSGFVICALE